MSKKKDAPASAPTPAISAGVTPEHTYTLVFWLSVECGMVPSAGGGRQRRRATWGRLYDVGCIDFLLWHQQKLLVWVRLLVCHVFWDTVVGHSVGDLKLPTIRLHGLPRQEAQATRLKWGPPDRHQTGHLRVHVERWFLRDIRESPTTHKQRDRLWENKAQKLFQHMLTSAKIELLRPRPAQRDPSMY